MYPQSPHNLPAQPNAILGRDHELSAARQQLLSGTMRLLSLTGPPGVGKTRLGMALAESCLESFPDGVWFVDLAPLQDAGLVGPEIACKIGLAETRDETMLDCLVTYLRGRRALLFLDNFEAVLPAAAWLGKLLERTPDLKVLATSRERLRLRWERTFVVPPLPLPEMGAMAEPSTLKENASIALFLERVAAVNPNFIFNAENAQTIAELCTHLDGLPLAIELAAARLSVLSPAEILTNLGDRFRLLRQGAPDLLERHQTMEAAIDWSYEALPEVEKQFLQRLSVFRGGFSLAAAEIVGDCEALGLDGLESMIALVEKSLVNTVRGSGGASRFTLFESIREYLLERLKASGGLDSAQQRHAYYYLELAELNYSQMKKGNQKPWFDELETEHDNLRLALQWSISAEEPTIGKRIAAALWYFWCMRGHIHEGWRWVEMFLAVDRSARDQTNQRLLGGAGMLLGWLGDHVQGKSYLMEALQIAKEREDQDSIVRALGGLGWISWINGRTEAAPWLADMMADSQLEDADPWDLAYTHLSLGSLFYEADLDETAENSFTRALDYFQAAEERHGAIFAGSKLSLLMYKKGDFQAAIREMGEALEMAKGSIDLHMIAYCADDAAQLVAQMALRSGLGRSPGQSLVRQQKLTKIVCILGAIDHWRNMLGLSRTPREKSAHFQLVENLRRQMGEPAYMRAWQAGPAISVRRVVEEIIALLEIPYHSYNADRQATEVDGIQVRLSQRELQVIDMVAEGLSSQEIAGRLFITERTVRFHLTSIFNKLGADNRAQAVAIANRLGIL